MIIQAPALHREEEATEENIAEIVRLLKGNDRSFAFVRQTNMTFIQTLWIPGGYILAYQENDIMHIYRAKEFVSQEDAIWALQSYLKGEEHWKSKFNFEHKTIDNPIVKMSYKLGTIAGKIIQFIKGK
jgi:cyclopropane fatty-acyl-phospholipid synthase-like methyltransferase